jgi:hypothetical protein
MIVNLACILSGIEPFGARCASLMEKGIGITKVMSQFERASQTFGGPRACNETLSWPRQSGYGISWRRTFPGPSKSWTGSMPVNTWQQKAWVRQTKTALYCCLLGTGGWPARAGPGGQQGYHIGSGTIESAAKQIGMQRMKVPGARWNEQSARRVAKARAAYLSVNGFPWLAAVLRFPWPSDRLFVDPHFHRVKITSR